MGGKQYGFSDYELTTAKKQTKREEFLAKIEMVVPCMTGSNRFDRASLAQSEQERQSSSIPTGHDAWDPSAGAAYSLSDPAMEEALIEVPTMRRVAGIELISDWIHDETTTITFRHLLEKHGLGEQILEPSKPISVSEA
jgi:IS5 family transposase